jgi:hypothetical protein
MTGLAYLDSPIPAPKDDINARFASTDDWRVDAFAMPDPSGKRSARAGTIYIAEMKDELGTDVASVRTRAAIKLASVV